MKLRCTLFFMLMTVLLRAQASGTTSGHPGFFVQAGGQADGFNAVNGPLHAAYGKAFAPVWKTAGLGLNSTLLVTRRGIYDTRLAGQLFIPETCIISDSLSFRRSGWGLTWTFFPGKDLFWRNDKFDLLYSAGIGGGQLFVREALDDSRIRWKQPYFGFLAALEPRLVFRPFEIGLRAEYLYDLSLAGWREGPEATAPGDLNFNGITVLLEAGWVFPVKNGLKGNYGHNSY